MTTLQNLQYQFEKQYGEVVPENVTPEQIKALILAFSDLLQELIKNEKVDAFLEKLENLIEDDKIGIFRGMITGFKSSLLSKKS